MTTSNMVEGTLLFCFYFFLALPKVHADPVNKKSIYSFVHKGFREHKIQFNEQRRGENFEYIASTITNGLVVVNGVINRVDDVFRVETATVSEKNSHTIRITVFHPVPSNPQGKRKNLKVKKTSEPDFLTNWELSFVPVLNRQRIDSLVTNGGATAAENPASLGHSESSSNYYTLPLGAFRANDLILIPRLNNVAVISSGGDIVQINAEMPYVVLSSYRIRMSPEFSRGHDHYHYRFLHGSVAVSIGIRITGQDSVRVESIRSIYEREDCPNFELRFLQEVQEEPLRSVPVRSGNDTDSGSDNGQEQFSPSFVKCSGGAFDR